MEALAAPSADGQEGVTLRTSGLQPELPIGSDGTGCGPPAVFLIN
jgi:hypothetical protein